MKRAYGLFIPVHHPLFLLPSLQKEFHELGYRCLCTQIFGLREIELDDKESFGTEKRKRIDSDPNFLKNG
jgi:hypothetical protein